MSSKKYVQSSAFNKTEGLQNKPDPAGDNSPDNRLKGVGHRSAAVTTYIFLACIAASAILLIIWKFQDKKEELGHRLSFFNMDTFVDIRSDSDIPSDIKNIFNEYNTALDRNDGKAETARLNSSGTMECSDILLNTVSETLRLNKKYGTLTDITVGRLTSLWNVTSENPKVPGEKDIISALETTGTENIILKDSAISLKNGAELDLGSVGKGAVLDCCFEYLKNNNFKKTIISTGSSLLLYGGEDFNVDIKDPEGNGSLAKVRTKYNFLSTSGGYERYFEADGKTYCHIIDPRTGYPTETDLTTVTVFSSSGIESDFLSTMIFTDGSENIQKYLDSADYKVFAADKNKNLYVSSGLEYEVLNEKYSK